MAIACSLLYVPPASAMLSFVPGLFTGCRFAKAAAPAPTLLIRVPSLSIRLPNAPTELSTYCVLAMPSIVFVSVFSEICFPFSNSVVVSWTVIFITPLASLLPETFVTFLVFVSVSTNTVVLPWPSLIVNLFPSADAVIPWAVLSAFSEVSTDRSARSLASFATPWASSAVSLASLAISIASLETAFASSA